MSSTNMLAQNYEKPVSRDQLKSLFQNKKQLSEASFCRLIDAVLNRADDKFHGVWQECRTYRHGDIVIHKQRFWHMVKAHSTICGEEPSEKAVTENGNERCWEAFTEDDNWISFPRDGDMDAVMWAKGNPRVGIGVGNVTGGYPQAKLDVRLGDGRWLLFPEEGIDTQHTFLHYEVDGHDTNDHDSIQKTSALITKLSIQEATWSSNAAQGFSFCHSSADLSEAAALQSSSDNKDDVMMVIRPHHNADEQFEFATLGLNVENPTALFDITSSCATGRQQFLALPIAQDLPTLALLHFEPEFTFPHYTTLAIDKKEAVWGTNTDDGFVFRICGDDYGQDFTKNEEMLSEQGLMRIRAKGKHPQVGIGTDWPEAYLEVCDRAPTSIQNHIRLLPLQEECDSSLEHTSHGAVALPMLSIISSQPTNQSTTYLNTGLEQETAGWITNASKGFVFRQQQPNSLPISSLNQGQANLIISADGRIGIGTEQPAARLDITSELRSGQFLFDVHNEQASTPAFAIVNHKKSEPEWDSDTYLTLGTTVNSQGTHAVMLTDAKGGFTFKAVEEGTDTNPTPLNLYHGQPLVHITPAGQLGVGKQPYQPFSLDVQGVTQSLNYYQVSWADWIDKETERELTGVLEKLKQLKPVTFEWTKNSGFKAEGRQIGLQANQLKKEFPEVVKLPNTSSDDDKASIAYQNLVPVLIQAINELNQQNQNQYNEFQKQENTQYYEFENKLKQLENRIALLAVALFVSWVFAFLGSWG